MLNLTHLLIQQFRKPMNVKDIYLPYMLTVMVVFCQVCYWRNDV